MAMTENLSAFFSAAQFATPATLGAAAVLGIFDRPYVEASLGLSSMASARATYTLPTAQAGAAIDQTLVVDGVGSFTVVESRPDGTGVTVLELERA